MPKFPIFDFLLGVLNDFKIDCKKILFFIFNLVEKLSDSLKPGTSLEMVVIPQVGGLFETDSFTNSTSGEENLQKLREIIAKKKTKILGIQDQFELHKQSLLDDREKMKKEIEALKQQSQYEVKSSVRRVIEFLLGGGVALSVLKGHFLGTKM